MAPTDIPGCAFSAYSTLEKLNRLRLSEEGWRNYKSIITELARDKSVIEIGAGRAPLFTPAEIAAGEIRYVANDISAAELGYLGAEYSTSRFDICQTVPEELRGQFDLVCSKMVLEHVPSGAAYYRNLLNLLKPGGMGVSFHPVLFSPPFVFNLLLPERISTALLRLFFPERNDSQIPKFPARYSYCFATRAHEERLRKIGFVRVGIIPLYGHGYFKSVPVIREIDRLMTRFAHNHDVRSLASFAYTVMEK